MRTETGIYEHREIVKQRSGVTSTEDDYVVREVPLTIMLNGEEFATLVCSPRHEKELVVGFLAGEGTIGKPEDIKDFYFREKQGVAWVETGDRAPHMEGFLRRNFTSCCGRGRPSLYFENDADQIAAVESDAVYPASLILALAGKLESASETHRKTGGVHTAALSIYEDMLVRYEDIGRHNALDRIMGYVFLNGIDTSIAAVILSGRVSSEILIKTARIGAPVVISRSAPTTLALDFAERLGITIVGFTRGSNLNVYTHSGRVLGL